jgi:hypothetical protein
MTEQIGQVPRYWDMEEIMPDIRELIVECINDQNRPFDIGESAAFRTGAKAMWEKLKAGGRIK